mgnify:CR=1 FL=1|tara:strand:- start:2259 stop:2915 length:657 start_codon:yes stop_codon:yes gene_type:complete
MAAAISDPRFVIVEASRRLEMLGLNLGTAGNVSIRFGDHYLITPTGVHPQKLTRDGIAELSLDGSLISGDLKPSSEWFFHSAIYAERVEAQAIVHLHSPYATALASVHREIPAFHYMVAVAGGDSIRCAPYATFGSPVLAGYVLDALQRRKACLLANHGQLSFGRDLEEAVELARWVEELARQYWIALQVGDPVILSTSDMEEVIEKFETYGQLPVTD